MNLALLCLTARLAWVDFPPVFFNNTIYTMQGPNPGIARQEIPSGSFTFDSLATLQDSPFYSQIDPAHSIEIQKDGEAVVLIGLNGDVTLACPVSDAALLFWSEVSKLFRLYGPDK